MINLQTVLYRLRIVIGTPSGLAALEHTPHKLLFGHLEADNVMNLLAAFLQEAVERLGLGIVRGNPSRITPSFALGSLSIISSRMRIISESGIS